MKRHGWTHANSESIIAGRRRRASHNLMETLSLVPAPPSEGGGGGGEPVAVVRYSGAPEQLHAIMALMGAELSEPYSIFTYRHFLEGWPELCFVVSRPPGSVRGAGRTRRARPPAGTLLPIPSTRARRPLLATGSSARSSTRWSCARARAAGAATSPCSPSRRSTGSTGSGGGSPRRACRPCARCATRWARGRGAGPRRARVRPRCRARRRARLTRPTPARSPRAQIVLETEETNTAALRLYERLGFVRDKRLPKYYLNNNDAFRLKAVLR